MPVAACGTIVIHHIHINVCHIYINAIYNWAPPPQATRYLTWATMVEAIFRGGGDFNDFLHFYFCIFFQIIKTSRKSRSFLTGVTAAWLW